MKNIKKLALIFAILIGSYFLLTESYNIYIDYYNFKQLEKVKIILKDYKGGSSKMFYDLSEFNKIYNSNIKPIKNCYGIVGENGKYSYLFGFKLESTFYNYIYGTGFYAYPKYNREINPVCTGYAPNMDFSKIAPCIDLSLNTFTYTISNPCKD